MTRTEAELKAYKELYRAYSKVDFFEIADVFNYVGKRLHCNSCDPYFKIDTLFDSCKQNYESEDMRKLVYKMSIVAMERYLLDVESNEEEPTGEFVVEGIAVKIDRYGVNITFSTVDVFTTEDE